jgi:hypothetical protein
MWEGGLVAGFVERIADIEEARGLIRDGFGEIVRLEKWHDFVTSLWLS